GFIVKRFKILV
nr:Chain A, peptide 536_2 [Hirudo medicinalis]